MNKIRKYILENVKNILCSENIKAYALFESRVVLIAYHGSPHNIEGNLFYKEDSFKRVSGLYFTKSFEKALKFTKIRGIEDPNRVVKVKLTFYNPAGRKDLDNLGYRLNGVEMKETLISMGFDGVIDNYMDEIVSFFPDQQVDYL